MKSVLNPVNFFNHVKKLLILPMAKMRLLLKNNPMV
jgi:hypothetical protein